MAHERVLRARASLTRTQLSHFVMPTKLSGSIAEDRQACCCPKYRASTRSTTTASLHCPAIYLTVL
eukprot:5753570-Pleurochrysis_carterae.AAC.1